MSLFLPPGHWVSGTHLHVGTIDWGSAHDNSFTYGAAYTATANGRLDAHISDSFYDDNLGSIHLEVFEQVTLDSMTVTNSVDSSETATATSSSSPTLTLTRDYNNESTVNVSGVVTPASGSSQAVYAVFHDGSKVSDISGGTAVLDWSTADNYNLAGGIDKNGNGLLEQSEITVQLAAKSETLHATVSSADASFNSATQTFSVTGGPNAGDVIPVPFTVTVTGNNGAPKANVTVLFVYQTEGGTRPSGITNGRETTGATGQATHEFQYGRTTTQKSYTVKIVDAGNPGVVLGTFTIAVN